MNDAKLTAHLRLFGLLALLIPLFLGLQYVLREGVPRVEVRLVSQDVQTTVPVEVPVERVVERVVYVPVDRETSMPLTQGTELAQTSLTRGSEVVARPEAGPVEEPRTEAVPAVAEAAPAVAIEPDPTTAPLSGTIAVAPPAPAPIVAAPVVARAVAPAPVYVAAAEEEAVDEAEPVEIVAEAEPTDGVADERQEVAEASEGATEEVAVVQFVSDEPMAREDDGPSIGMLRHELAVREARPVVVEREAAEEAAPVAWGDDPGPAEEGAAGEPEVASEPVAEGEEVVGEASSKSSEELLEHAPSIKAEMLDHGGNNEQSLGVLEHQLVARPAGPAPAAESPEAEAEGEAVVAEGEADEPGPADDPAVAETPADLDETAWSEADEGAGDEPVAIEEVGAPEVARTEDATGLEEEPEQ